MSYNYDIQDMELTSIVDYTNDATYSGNGKVLQLSESGGSESAHIVIEIPDDSNGSSIVAEVQHCDTPDGEFVNTGLIVNGQNEKKTEKRWRIPLDMKRYIRLHVETHSTGAEGQVRLTVRV